MSVSNVGLGFSWVFVCAMQVRMRLKSHIRFFYLFVCRARSMVVVVIHESIRQLY